MYEQTSDKDETDNALAAWGLKGKSSLFVATEDSVEIWPENIEVVVLFNELSTQWRIGMSGATGLDYNVLFHKLDRLVLTNEEYQAVESDIRTMEYAALKEMRKETNK